MTKRKNNFEKNIYIKFINSVNFMWSEKLFKNVNGGTRKREFKVFK